MANVLTSYYMPKPGGFCKRLFRAIRALLERGHTVHYLAIEPFPIDHPNCIFHRFPWPKRYSDSLLFWCFFILLSPLCLFYIGISNRITHAFAFGTAYSFCMQPLRWAGRVGLTCFLRGDAVLNHKLRHRPALIVGMEILVEGIGIRGVHIIGVAPHLITSVKKRHSWMLPAKCSVLFNDMPCASQEMGRDPSEPVRFALVGIIEPLKNYGYIVDILRELKGLNWHLSIFGEGPDRSKLLSLVQKHELCSQISFRGWQKSERIWPNTNLLIFPSIHEGMPNAVLEALADHVAVIASDISAHRNILPPQNLIPLADREAWRRTLREVIDDPTTKLKRLQHRQDQFVARLVFDWEEKVVEMIVDDKVHASAF